VDVKINFKSLANEDILLDTKCFLTKSETIFVSRTQNLRPQQMLRARKQGNICVGNNESAAMCPRLPGPLIVEKASENGLMHL